MFYANKIYIGNQLYERSKKRRNTSRKGKPKKKSFLEMKRARILSKKLALLQRNNKFSNVITKYYVRNDLNPMRKKKRYTTGHLNPFSTETESEYEKNKQDGRGNRLKHSVVEPETSDHEQEEQTNSDHKQEEQTKSDDEQEEQKDSVDEQEEQKRLWYQGVEMVSEEEDYGGKLELVSRFPCIQSGPYLAQDRMKPKGWLAEAEDDDTIQRYLICKATGGLRKKGNKTVCDGGVPKDPPESYKKGDRYFHFPGDGDHILHRVDTEEPIDQDFIGEYTKNPDKNKYWLYTRYNPIVAQIIGYGDKNSLEKSNFNFSKTTVFLAHGWLGDARTTMNKLLTQAFLGNDDVNVIVLDWSKLAKKGYVTARHGTPAVGRNLGQFVTWLVVLGASYERIHLVGHSLGGHLVGNAGRETGGLVRRVTALDPAGPLWSSHSERVVSTDAQYVEVIHTNIGGYGYSDPCGDADFYPNGGKRMPGCFLKTCDHSRSYEYMVATVRFNNLFANECASLRAATRDRCRGDLYPMGNSDLTKSRSGIFRVNTGKEYPFKML